MSASEPSRSSCSTGADGRLRSRREGRGDDPRRGGADAEQPAFALGHDLEPDRVAVEAGREALQLTDGRPLGLTDRLALRLDGDLVAHRRP